MQNTPDGVRHSLPGNRAHACVPRQNARIVVVGAGLAGLTAALMAPKRARKSKLVAQGQGALTLHPGWIETGDVDALAQDADHPYRTRGRSRWRRGWR